MRRCFLLSVITFLGIDCFLLLGCGNSTPTVPTVTSTMHGFVASVDPDSGLFTLQADDGSAVYRIDARAAQFQGAGITSFDALVAAYRRGSSLTAAVTTRDISSWSSDVSHKALEVQVEMKEGRLRYFASYQMGPRIWPTTYLQGYRYTASVFILPWTEFDQGGEFKSWDALSQYSGGTVCSSGMAYEVSPDAFHAITLRAWPMRLVEGCRWP